MITALLMLMPACAQHCDGSWPLADGPEVDSPPDTTDTPTDQAPELALDKRVASVTDVNGNGPTDAGDTISWEFELTEYGQRDVDRRGCERPAGGAVTCPVTTLAAVPRRCARRTTPRHHPGRCGCRQRQHGDRCGEGPGGDPNDPSDDVPPNPDSTVTPTDQVPGLVLDKRVASVTDVNGNGLTDAGDEIAYEFELTNTGTVTLTDLAVSDPLAGAVTCPVTTLAPGASTVCAADTPYVITAADVDAGNVHNRATAVGEGPGGDPNDPSDDVRPTRTPRHADRPGSGAGVGQAGGVGDRCQRQRSHRCWRRDLLRVRADEHGQRHSDRHQCR